MGVVFAWKRSTEKNGAVRKGAANKGEFKKNVGGFKTDEGRFKTHIRPARDKKFEYGLALDWYGTVHIGIASCLLSLTETWNEVSRYGSSMALKTGQLTTISHDPAAVVYQRRLVHTQKEAVYQGRFIHTPNEMRRHCKSIEGVSSILQTENIPNSQITNKLICKFIKSDYIQFATSRTETTSCGFPATKSSPPPRKK